MTPEHDTYLCTNYPLLYADRHASMSHTCMCWGFECGDGWFELIRTLSDKLEYLISLQPEAEQENFRASQAKEKYGGLRLYMTGGTDEMYDLIDAAEKESYTICEECGEPGTHRSTGGWYYTSCEKHVKRRSQSGH